MSRTRSLVRIAGAAAAAGAADDSRDQKAAKSDLASRLYVFYSHYAPQRLRDDPTLIPDVVAHYGSFRGGSLVLFKTLERKYGSEANAIAAAKASAKNYEAASRDEVRARVEAMYKHYNPQKANAAHIDACLKSYQGREALLLANLVSRYGAEPDAMGRERALAATGGRKVDNYARLVRFYSKYSPSKLSTVDAALRKYAGREEEMFQVLVAKYGPEPPDEDGGGDGSYDEVDAEARERLRRFYAKYNPQRLDSVDTILKRYRDDLPLLMEQLVAKYGPEPPAPNAKTLDLRERREHFRARLIRFYEKYNSRQVALVTDEYLDRYIDREDDLFAKLVAKYGPEPGDEDDVRARLVAFYEDRGMSHKLGDVDKLLAVFEGQMAKMFAMLEAKYGTANNKQFGGVLNKDFAAAAFGVAAVEEEERDSIAPEVRRKLIEFFERHGLEEKIQNVDLILLKFRDNYDHMWNLLHSKYGNDDDGGDSGASGSGDGMDPHSRLVRFWGRYAPEKVMDDGSPVNKALAAYKGREESMFKALCQKYRAEEPDFRGEKMDHKSRLTRFFQKYDKMKIPQIDDLLTKYADKEDQLWTALRQKYGPEPVPQPPHSSIGSIGSSSSSSSKSKKSKSSNKPTESPAEKLMRYYQFYEPTKANDDIVQEVLARYVGNTAQLFLLLKRKYGPPPPLKKDSHAANVENVDVIDAATFAVPTAVTIPPEQRKFLRQSALHSPSHEARIRLTKIFRAHDRPKLAQLEELLTKNADRLDAFVAETEAFYGNRMMSHDQPLVQFDAKPALAQLGEATLCCCDLERRAVHAFMRGANGQVLHAVTGRADEPFTAWRSLGGNAQTRVAVVSAAPDTMDVLVAEGNCSATPGAVLHMHIDADGIASPWESIGGDNAAPSVGVCTTGDPADGGSLHVFCRNAQGQLTHRQRNGDGSWAAGGGAFEVVPGTALLGPPVAVARAATGRIDVFARGPGDALFTTSHDADYVNNGGKKWSEWRNLGGRLGGPPRVVVTSDSTLEIFVRDADTSKLQWMHCKTLADGNNDFAPFRALTSSSEGDAMNGGGDDECFGDLSVSFEEPMITITSRNSRNEPQYINIPVDALLGGSGNTEQHVWEPVARNQERYPTFFSPAVLTTRERTVVVVNTSEGTPVANIFFDRVESWVGWRELIGGTGDTKRIRAVYDSFDVDGNAVLDRSESIMAFMCFFDSESPTAIAEMVQQADLNNDGVLDFAEFAEIARYFV